MAAYSLKPIETQLLKVIIQQQNSLLSNTLSFIALERLAINVDDYTKFELSENMDEMAITQQPAVEDAGIVTEMPKETK